MQQEATDLKFSVPWQVWVKNSSEINTSHAPYVARKTGIDTTTAFKTVIGSAINAVAQITVEALMMIRVLFPHQ